MCLLFHPGKKRRDDSVFPCVVGRIIRHEKGTGFMLWNVEISYGIYKTVEIDIFISVRKIEWLNTPLEGF